MPKITGTPVSRPTRMRAWLTLSQIYSKCMVLPLSKVPIGMIASKGFLSGFVDEELPPMAGESSREDAVAPIKDVLWI